MTEREKGRMNIFIKINSIWSFSLERYCLKKNRET